MRVDPGAPAPARHRVRIPAPAVDVLLALPVVGSALAPAGGHMGPDFDRIPLPWLLLAAALVIVRRYRPVPVLVAAALLEAGLALAGLQSPAVVLPVVFAMYRVALVEPRRTTVVLAAGAAVLLPVASLLGTSSGAIALLSGRAVQLAALVGFAAAIGTAIRARRGEVAALEERAERAERTRESEARRRVAEDRLAIARDLHDTVAHRIAVINLHAGAASRGLHDRPDEAEHSLEVIREAARSVLTDIGGLLTQLRTDPSLSAPRPDPAALARLDDLLAGFRRAGLEVTRHGALDVRAVPGATAAVAAQVIQEGLTNAAKHGTGPVDLETRQSADVLEVRLGNAVRPPVRGSVIAAPPGNGLLGVRERVVSVHGRVETRLEHDRFELHAVLPLAPAGTTGEPSRPVPARAARP